MDNGPQTTEQGTAAEWMGPHGVDRQVMIAATMLTKDQASQPEWVWFGGGEVSFGRWQREPTQAPYVRADLVVNLLRSLGVLTDAE